MKKHFDFLTMSLVFLALIVCFVLNCARDYDYVELQYADFMDKTHGEIAGDIAGILDVSPITYSGKVVPGSIPDELGSDQSYIKEGFQYITANNAKITVYVDDNDRLYVITYLLKRQGTSDDWSYSQEEADSNVISTITQIGIPLDGSEDFSSHQCAGISIGYYYDIVIKQTFMGMLLEYPYIHLEIEGETGEINFLKICRWYINLNEIDDILSDDDLALIAMNYFVSSDEIMSIESTDADGYYIIRNGRLCRIVGHAAIDRWGSTMSLIIDVQSGEIVGVSRNYVCGQD